MEGGGGNFELRVGFLFLQRTGNVTPNITGLNTQSSQHLQAKKSPVSNIEIVSDEVLFNI
jgi:hypothetical protein